MRCFAAPGYRSLKLRRHGALVVGDEFGHFCLAPVQLRKAVLVPYCIKILRVDDRFVRVVQAGGAGGLVKRRTAGLYSVIDLRQELLLCAFQQCAELFLLGLGHSGCSWVG